MVRPDFATTLLFTDECNFALDGAFKTQNKHLLTYAIYSHAHQRCFSINIWPGTIEHNLIGPYLLPECLDGEKYLTFLQEILLNLLKEDSKYLLAVYVVPARRRTSSRCDTYGRDLTRPIDYTE